MSTRSMPTTQQSSRLLINSVQGNSGVQRTSRLLELGVPRRVIEQAVTEGKLLRPKRGWVAKPGTDPELLIAIEHHVVLSCVTQAKRLGLWVRTDPHQCHVAAPNTGAKVRSPSLVVHWGEPLVPRPPFALEDHLVNVLQRVARCLPREDALVIWESALNKRLTDVLYLSRLPLGRQERQLLRECTPFSDSGLETLVCSRLRWLRIPLRQQIYLEGHPVDVLIGRRLVIQLDGAHHTGKQRDIDTAHDAALTRRGYNVLRFSYVQVMYYWDDVQGAILDAIAQGAHLVSQPA